MNNHSNLSNQLWAGIESCRVTLKTIQLAAALTALLTASTTASAGNTWTGGGDPDGNWSNAANWGGVGPDYGVTLTFAGTTGLNSTNDSATASVVGLTFDSTAGDFVISGSAVTLGGTIVNNSTNTQTLNLNLSLTANRNVNAASGPLELSGVISGSYNVIKGGGFPVTLNASGSSYNTFQVNQGTAILGVNDAIPTTATLNLASGSTSLDMNGKTQTLGLLRLNGSGTGTVFDSVVGGLLKLGSGGVDQTSGTKTGLISVPVDLNGATQTFKVLLGNTITISGPITNSSGTAGLTKISPGTLILSGTNSYNGDTTVTAGTLQLDVACLNSAASVSISDGAVLNLNFTATNLIFALFTNGVAVPSGIYDAAALPGLIAGSGALQVLSTVSAGIWDGGGSDGNWSTGANWDNDVVPVFPIGLTFVGPGGLLNTNDLLGAIANSITFDGAAGAFVIGGNAVTLGGNINFNADPSSPVTQTINLDMDLGGASRIIFTQPNGDIVLGGVISGNNTLFKNNSGTLTLSGANTFTGGAVQVRAGTLKLGANEVIPGALTLNPNGVPATLDLNGKTETLSATVALTFANSGGTEFVIDSAGGGLLKLEGNVHLNNNAGPATISADVELADADGTQLFGVYDATSTLTVSGTITSASVTTTLVKVGVGTLILAGTNSYNCDTTVNDGTLQVDVACLSATNAVYLAGTNGAVLNLNFAGTNLVSALYTNGVALPDGVYNASNLSGLITGGGALEVAAAPASTPGNLVDVVVSGGSLTFNITNTSGSYIIEATTNLALPGSWAAIHTNTAPFSFTDTNAVNLFPQRFYRSVAE